LANKLRIEEFDQTVKLHKETHKAVFEYWKEYSIPLSFEFWMMVALLVVPLVILFLKIDKSRLFLLGFYGFSFHTIFGYIDAYGRNIGLWAYPFPLIPPLPGIVLDASLVPITFMLVYQWTIKHKKNYYVFATLTSAVLAFIFKPLIVKLGLFKMYEGIHYIHLFGFFLIVVVAAKQLTNVFIWLEKSYKERD
jgi:hypothetical protein